MKSNYHTHSVYCDGADSLEDMARTAIDKGFDLLGFSGHSYTFFDTEYCMSRENTEKYRSELSALKQKYQGKIQILSGIEQDYFSDAATEGYDFVIGSVHYVFKNGKYYAIDDTAEKLARLVTALYAGDYLTMCEDYFSLVGNVVEKTGCNIIGHFDLVAKFNENDRLFCQSHSRYVSAAKAAVNKLLPYGKPFEINTGAMASGCRTQPYPAPWLIDLIAKGGGKFILSSDCHHKSKLDYGFDDLKAMAHERGWPLIEHL